MPTVDIIGKNSAPYTVYSTRSWQLSERPYFRELNSNVVAILRSCAQGPLHLAGKSETVEINRLRHACSIRQLNLTSY